MFASERALAYLMEKGEAGWNGLLKVAGERGGFSGFSASKQGNALGRPK